MKGCAVHKEISLTNTLSSVLPCAHRRPHEHLDIAPPGGVHRDNCLHVLEVVDLGLGPEAGIRLDREEQGS